MSKEKFTDDTLNDKIARNIEAGWADNLQEPSDEDFDNLDQPPPDEEAAENLNAYDREVRYGAPRDTYHVTPEARRAEDERTDYHSVSPTLSGGDVDAAWQQAEGSGEESVGGTVSTPDQDQVDELGRAVGMELQDNQELRGAAEVVGKRDKDRWELDRRSADDASPDGGRRTED